VYLVNMLQFAKRNSVNNKTPSVNRRHSDITELKDVAQQVATGSSDNAATPKKPDVWGGSTSERQYDLLNTKPGVISSSSTAANNTAPRRHSSSSTANPLTTPNDKSGAPATVVNSAVRPVSARPLLNMFRASKPEPSSTIDPFIPDTAADVAVSLNTQTTVVEPAKIAADEELESGLKNQHEQFIINTLHFRRSTDRAGKSCVQ
jgi:hypothetical protein